jgi:predicted MPP superfamily phosphohydrolase
MARLASSRLWRVLLGAIGLAVYFTLVLYNLFWVRSLPSPTRLTWQAALLQAPFWWWIVCSALGFALVIPFWAVDRLVRGIQAAYRRRLRPESEAGPPSPSRRHFLERTAVTVGAAPFVAGAYGLFYGRLDLEITNRRIRLKRLPKSFTGFRIAQLSDIHIGPFMTEEEIRRCVTMTNELKPDLVVLTGDFVTWRPAPQEAVVSALAGLRAPFGVFGCLGNHEIYAGVEDSITRLFAARGIRVLRREKTPIQLSGETLNLIGVDSQSVRRLGRHGEGLVRGYLEGVQQLLLPDTVNILLSHNPNSFDRAAELGIDLSLAGHTHGGQVTLEFIHPSLTPSRLITRYVKGWFQKEEAQLYVNRGIGTILAPIRVGAPPEITLLELVTEG